MGIQNGTAKNGKEQALPILKKDSHPGTPSGTPQRLGYNPGF
jgi:hypothetical protein